MLLSVISDIHGNLEALERALEISKELKCDRIMCLGDIVGYGPDPEACVKRVREVSDDVLMGNHDQAVVQPDRIDQFNEMARSAVFWTQRQLSAESMKYLRNLPYTSTWMDLLFVHASPKNPEEWKYLFTPDDAAEQLDAMMSNVCFVGHTHVPQFFTTDPAARGFTLKTEHKYIINVGSVGQPRDGDARLSFGLFDTDRRIYQPVRAQYDAKQTARKIRATDLPSFLADRLLRGR